ncbi:DUF5995 family protein [Motilibacter aurantiacus]|uniref:DUF5995 family protein n=1 Tax=Motilibacter aurantiacus TaxID=2714955 RepID=UPI00140C53E9|nr:DUF5995 family protein [Motilibacter aurantiacus]NHC45126.1 hypothetical protein [Motilibacter aurantiacus]
MTATQGSGTSIDEVVARLHTIASTLPDGDGVDCFTRMYLQVTELVRDELRKGFFRDPEFMERLDVVFAGLFIEAVDAPRGKSFPKAWAPLFDARDRNGVEPIQFALAGMNAHINADLPLAVVQTCRQLGRSPREDVVEEDYDRINQLLARVEADIRRSFLDGLAAEVDRRVSPLVTLVCNWSIEKARDAAWAQSHILWALRHVPPIQDDAVGALRRTVGMASSLLLVPVQL